MLAIIEAPTAVKIEDVCQSSCETGGLQELLRLRSLQSPGSGLDPNTVNSKNMIHGFRV